jgi:hypothetical protein
MSKLRFKRKSWKPMENVDRGIQVRTKRGNEDK